MSAPSPFRRFIESRAFLYHENSSNTKTPDPEIRGDIPIGNRGSLAATQSLLSSRLYCRFWNFTKSAAQRRSRTIPPVGNFTPPRRTIFICSITEYHIFICYAIIFYPCKFPLSGNVHRNVLLPFRREAPPSR